jgi:hypothetical protein
VSGKKNEPTGPIGLNWTYLRSYGSGDRYAVGLYRGYDGTDSIDFVHAAEGVPEYAVGEYTLDFDREELDRLIAELTWLRDNWGEVGRG